MAERTNNVRVLQAAGIVASSFAAGAIFSMSNVAIPTTKLAPPSVAVKQWSTIFWNGLKTGPPGAVIAGLSFGILANALPAQRRLYSLAAFFPLAIFPFTNLALVPVNNELMKREKAAAQLKEGEAPTEVGLPAGQGTYDLIQTWGNWNYIRSTLPLVGAMLGSYLAFS